MAADIQDFDIGLLDGFFDAHSSCSSADDQSQPIFFESYSDNSQLNEQLTCLRLNDPEDAEAAEMDHSGADVIKDQDRFLPLANVMKIMKLILPPEMKISQKVKYSMQECASEFISFVTSEANDHRVLEKRKSINGEDVIWAMDSLGFDRYVHVLKNYMKTIKRPRNSKRKDEDDE